MLDHGTKTLATLKSLETIQLPGFPHTLVQLLDLLSRSDSDVQQFAEVVATDAAIASKVLTAVNSSAFGLQVEITDLKHAVTLLGTDTLKDIAMTSAVQQLFAGINNLRAEFLCQKWLDSLFCATLAKQLAAAIGYSKEDDAYLAGLLHDFGQLIIDAQFHQHYENILKQKDQSSLVDMERKQFGIDHAELGAQIIEQWSCLSQNIAIATRYHHRELTLLEGSDPLCMLLAEASLMAHYRCEQGHFNTLHRSSLVSEEQLARIYQYAEQEVFRIASSLGIRIPGVDDQTFEAMYQDVQEQLVTLAERVRDNALLNSLTRTSLQNSSGGSEWLLNKVSQDFWLLFGIDSIGVMIPDSEANTLAFLCSNTKSTFTEFKLNAKSSITSSYHNQSPIWIQRDMTGHVIDQQVLQRLQCEHALCMPIVNKGDSEGIVIIGCQQTGKSFMEQRAPLITQYLSQLVNWQQSINSERRAAQLSLKKFAHEISNPISILSNYVEIIKQSIGSDSSMQHDIQVLMEELARVRQIIIQQSQSSNTNDGVEISLNQSLQDCIPTYLNGLEKGQSVQLIWQLDSQDVQVMIDVNRFRQIVLNLLKNAVEALPDKGEITVRSYPYLNLDGNAYAAFSIDDNGSGIDNALLGQMFLPKTSKKPGAHRGVGLALVKEVVEQVCGKVSYKKNAKGGATFEIMLPLSQKNTTKA